MKGDGREQSALGCNLLGVHTMLLANPHVDVGQPLARCLTLGKG